MATIDERVVAMSFENSKFEASIATTMASLGKLDTTIANIGKVNGLASIETSASKVTLTGPMSALDKLKQKLGMTTAGTTFTDMEKASDKVSLTEPMTALDKLQQKLGMTGAGTTFTDMEKAADRISFSGLTSAIDGIGSHFSAVSTAIGVAIGNLTTQVALKAGAMIKSISVDPILEGFHNYETQINAIQTILANTGLKGKAGLDKVNSSLRDLQKYANLTVYNFSEMAKNIGTFTAAGVKLGPAVQSIKGIANLAALSGSNSQQASTAMYQLSQAIAAGKVGLQDWNSVVNAGMGGAVFQKALIRTGQAMGTISDGAVKIDKATGRATINGEAFRQSISAKPGQTSWLTSDVLVKTLGQFTGDLSDAQLKAEGFNAAQIKAIQSTAKTAKNAATQIKTFSQLTQALKEEVGTAWGNIFATLFGNINQAKTLFSGLHTFMENALTGPINAFNKVLQGWAKLGGRTELLQGLKSAFTDLGDILKPIHEAFREIFPPTTSKSLFDLTTRFKELMDNLRPAPATMDEIRRTFKGLFAVLHIGWTVIKDVAGVFGKLLSVAKPAAGGILGITANLGDFLTKLDQSISKEGLIKGLFGGLSGVISGPITLIKELGSAIKSLFTGASIGGAVSSISGPVDTLRKALGPLSGLLDGAEKAWNGFLGILGKIKTALSPLLTDVANVIGNFGDIVANGIKNANYDKVFAAINTTLLGGIFLAIKKALGGGLSVDFGGGVLKSISKTFEALTGNLEAMQKNIEAGTLLKIAAAIGILAAGVALLSLIDPNKLTKALSAVAIGMGELVAALIILNSAVKGPAFIKMPFIAGSLVLLSVSLVILAGAMKIFATMSWSELAKGLVGVGGALTAISVGVKAIDGPKIAITAAALIPLAVGLNILAVAMKIFATMSWEEIAKGLSAVGGSLTVIGVAMKAMPKDLPVLGAGLVIVGAGMVILAGAVLAFGHMKLETLAKGILAMGAALVVIGAAIDTFPPSLVLQAAALVLISAGMTTLAVAIGALGSMRLTTLIKGLAAMGGALAILAIGLDAMGASLPGAAGLIAAAAGFDLLAPALAAMGSLSWGTILKGLAAMALTMGVLAVVGGLAAVPLLALGVAVLALGAGLAAVGAAVYLFAKGISLLSDTSVKAMAAVITAVTIFVAAFPKLVVNFIKGIVDILGQVVDLAPKIISALVSIISQLLDAIIKLTPKIAEAIGALIEGIVKVVNDNAGPIIAAGFKLLLNLLSGIADNIGQVTDSVVKIITTFLGELAKHATELVDAGAKVLTNFLSGIIHNIPHIVGVVANFIATFLNAIANNMHKIIDAGFNIVIKFVTSIANNVRRVFDAGIKVVTGFLNGVAKSIPNVISAATNIMTKFINAAAKALVKLVDVGFHAMINFMNGLARTIRNNSKQLSDAAGNVAVAIIDGLVNGLANLAWKVAQEAWNIAWSIPGTLLKILGIESPSKVTMEIGKMVMLGLSKGMDDNTHAVDKSVTSAANNTVKSLKSAFAKVPDAINGVINTNPVITPVLDLSNVKKNASTLSDMLPDQVLTAKTSSDHAVRISHQKTVLDTATAGKATTFNFEQNNYSPDPLRTIEIYRQTNNQLSKVKSLVSK